MYFVGACIGSIVCGIYQFTWPARLTNVRDAYFFKKLLLLRRFIRYLFFSVSQQYVISGILIVSCGFMFWINTIALCIARLLAGFCYGFIYITLITQVADNVMKTVRGYMASGLAQSTLLGLIIGVGFSEHSWKAIPYMRVLFCIILIGFPVSSIILNRFLTYEPITRLLKMNQETEAYNVLNKLRIGKIESSVIQYEIDERKRMLLEDYSDLSQCCGFQNVFSNGNGMTILWMVLLRLLYVLTANMYLFILSAIEVYQDLNYLMHMMLMLARLLILLIPHYSMDKLGRRGLFLTSGLGSGILLIPFAAQQLTDIHIRGDLIAIITFGIHIFAALGIEPVQPIYASEAFPLSQRNASLAIVTCFEYILHGIIAILVLLGEELTLKIFLVITPFAVLLLTIILFVKLPETKSMPLRRCRDQFNKNIKKKTLSSRDSGIHTLGSTYM